MKIGYRIVMMVGLSLSITAMAVDSPSNESPMETLDAVTSASSDELKVGGGSAASGTVGSSVTNAASGRNAAATVDIGVIKQGAKTGGNATAIGAVGGGVTNQATGDGATARISIGVIGSSDAKGSE